MPRKRVILLGSDSFGIESFYNDLKEREKFEIKKYKNIFQAVLKNFTFEGIIVIQTKSILLAFLLPNKKYILVLHGFIGLREYSLLSFILKNMIILLASKKCEVWSNSLITANINSMMLNVNSIRILYPAEPFYLENTNHRRDIYFLFVGRNTVSKNITLSRMIVDSYNMLKKENLKLKVVSNSVPVNEVNNIDFVGPLNRDDVFKLMRRAVVFISMNPLEPYGIVYEEALSCGCYVIVPRNAGFAERYHNHDRVILVDTNDPLRIAKKIFEKIG